MVGFESQIRIIIIPVTMAGAYPSIVKPVRIYINSYCATYFRKLVFSVCYNQVVFSLPQSYLDHVILIVNSGARLKDWSLPSTFISRYL